MTMTATEQAAHVSEVSIKASPEEIWEAITKPEFTTRYFDGSAVDSTLEPGTPWRDWPADRSRQPIDGEVLESDPPRRLRHTWRALFDEEQASEPSSRVTWEIEAQEGGYSKLTVVHDRLERSPNTAESVAGGWMLVLSGLKTLLETGRPLAEPSA